MKLVLIFLIVLSTVGLYAQGQAIQTYEKIDEELNRVYQQLIREYSYDSSFVEKIRNTQRNWLTFRDSEVEMKFPQDKYPKSSNAIENCRFEYLSELTEKRTSHLKQWLSGTEDFIACSGTIFSRANEGEPPFKMAINEEVLHLYASMKRNYHFFGYALPDFASEKLILFSVGTKPVQTNYKNCKYGAYYATQGEFNSKKNYTLKYLSEDEKFIKSKLIRNYGSPNEEEVDLIYFDKYWVNQ